MILESIRHTYVSNYRPETNAGQRRSIDDQLEKLIDSTMPKLEKLVLGEYSRALMIPGVKNNQQVSTSINKLKKSLAKAIGKAKDAKVEHTLGTVMTDYLFPYFDPKKPGYVATMDHDSPGRFNIKAVFPPRLSVFSHGLTDLYNKYVDKLVGSDGMTVDIAINLYKWVGDEFAPAIPVLHQEINQLELDLSVTLVEGREFNPEDVDIRFIAGVDTSGVDVSINKAEAFFKKLSSSRVETLKAYKKENSTAWKAVKSVGRGVKSVGRGVKSVGRGVKGVVTNFFEEEDDDDDRPVPGTRVAPEPMYGQGHKYGSNTRFNRYLFSLI
jgi:hypothetical protein